MWWHFSIQQWRVFSIHFWSFMKTNEILRDFSLKVCQDFVCKIWVKTLFHQWPPGGALVVNSVNKSSFHGQFLGTRPKSNAILVFKAISNFVNFWGRPNIWVWIWLFLMEKFTFLESISWFEYIGKTFFWKSTPWSPSSPK